MNAGPRCTNKERTMKSNRRDKRSDKTKGITRDERPSNHLAQAWGLIHHLDRKDIDSVVDEALAAIGYTAKRVGQAVVLALTLQATAAFAEHNDWITVTAPQRPARAYCDQAAGGITHQIQCRGTCVQGGGTVKRCHKACRRTCVVLAGRLLTTKGGE